MRNGFSAYGHDMGITFLINLFVPGLKLAASPLTRNFCLWLLVIANRNICTKPGVSELGILGTYEDNWVSYS